MPPSVVIGADPVTFDVTITNSGLGTDLLNGRLQVTLRGDTRRQWLTGGTYNPWTSALTPSIAYSLDGESFTTATITSTIAGGTSANSGKWTVLGPDTGIAIPAGDEVTVTVRLGLDGATNRGPVVAIFEVMEVDPGTGLPAPAMTPGPVTLAEIQSGTAGLGPSEGALASLPVFFAAVGQTRLTPSWTGSIQSHTVHAGQTARLGTNINTNPTTVNQIYACRGGYSVEFDGKPVPIAHYFQGEPVGFFPSIRKACQPTALNAPQFRVPVDTPPGVRSVTVRYSGDEFFEPAVVWSGTLTVLAPRTSAVYTCATVGIVGQALPVEVNVTASAIVPAAAAAGTGVDLGGMEVTLRAARSSVAHLHTVLADAMTVGTPAANTTLSTIAFTLAGGAGEGAALGMVTGNRSALPPSPNPQPDPNLVDTTFGFTGATGTVTIDGTHGEVVPVTLDRIAVAGVNASIIATAPVAMDCTPLGDPIALGEVAVAGTSLEVDAPTAPRPGDAVTLHAQVHPLGVPGVVEFTSETSEGTTAVGMAPVDPATGTASFTTTGLPAGTHELRARFFGGMAAISTTSVPVALTVEATACEAFAVAGSGAVVRLVYLELLGRCPDQAGFTYWTGQLDAGTSPEAFARTIARTPEAVGVVVDDGYRTMLGRDADAAGRAFWVGRLIGGSGRYDHLLADLAGSGEFWNLAGATNAGFVTRVYDQLLGRAPEPAGLDYWTGRLDGGASPRSLVLALANLDEPLGALVEQSYGQILARTPAAAERTAGIALLRATGDRSAFYAQLIGTPEFTQRAQGFPNPGG